MRKTERLITKLARDRQLALLDRRFRRPLMRFFLNRARTRAEAEDMTQDVFVRLMRYLDNHELSDPDAFVFKIATNLLRDRARQERSRGLVAEQPLPGADLEDGFESTPAQLTDVLDPEHLALAREDVSELVSVLGGMHETTRNIFILFRMEGMPQRQIADLYGISVSAVEKHVAKAMKHLVDQLTHE